MREERIVFHEVDDERKKRVSYGRLSLDTSTPSMIVSGQFDDPSWEVVTMGVQRLTLYSEVLASLKALEVLKKIGISDEGLTSARAMMAQLFESNCSKCERDVVDEVLQHPRVRELTG